MGCPLRGCLRFCCDYSSVLQVKLVLVDLEDSCVFPADDGQQWRVQGLQLEASPVETGRLEKVVVFYAFPAADSQPPSRLGPQQAAYEVLQLVTDGRVVPVPVSL